MGKAFDIFDLFGKLGSFWDFHMVREEQNKIENIVALSLENDLLHEVDQTGRGLGGLTVQTKRNIAVYFSPETAFKTYSAPGEDPVRFDQQALDAGITTAEFFHVVPFESDVFTPLHVSSKKGPLALNVDFFYSNDYLWFVSPLEQLFANGELIIKLARHEISSYFRSTLRTTTPYFNTDIIADFYRNKLELRGLERATQIVGRLPVIRLGGKVVAKHPHKEGFKYFFDSEEVVSVPFPHEEFIVQQFVGPNTVPISGPISFILPEEDNDLWYRKTDWCHGLSLEGLTIYHGLLVQDNNTWAFTNGMDFRSVNGDKVHARMHLIGSVDVQDVFWKEVARRETITGEYLNDFIGLGNEVSPNYQDTQEITPDGLLYALAEFPNTKRVNPLDIFFQVILKDFCFVVVLDEQYLTNREEVINFIRQNAPPNIYPIIRIKKADGGVVDLALEGFYKKLHLLVDEEGVAIALNAKWLGRFEDEPDDQDLDPFP